MIDSLRALLTESALPNLHAALVHFPVALLMVAPLFDLGCMVFRRRTWLDRAASSLYVIGTLGAGAAYLSGERAADALGNISPAVEAAVADHHDLAFITLLAFVAITLLRLLVTWLARDDRRIRLGIFRLVALPTALAGLLLLALTADHGGGLVYRHGVGVAPDFRAAHDD
ncbi:MAG: DUF2231 domain-containing protein [Thermoanaerobaculales bacterium]